MIEITINNKCPECNEELSAFAGLRSTPHGEEWVQRCNNRNCNFELILPVKETWNFIDETVTDCNRLK